MPCADDRSRRPSARDAESRHQVIATASVYADGIAIASPVPSRSCLRASSTRSCSSACAPASVSRAAKAFRVGPYQVRKNSTNSSAERNRKVKSRSRHLERRDLVAEQALEVLPGAPQHRRADAGGRWHVGATVRNSSPMNPSGVQLASAIVPPGLGDAHQLGGGLLVVRGEHRPEHRGHRVERAVGERQRLRVALEQGHVEPFGGRPLAAAVEQARDVVDADRLAAEPCGRDGRVAAAGCDVEHVPAGVEVGRVDQLLRDEHDPWLRRRESRRSPRPAAAAA